MAVDILISCFLILIVSCFIYFRVKVMRLEAEIAKLSSSLFSLEYRVSTIEKALPALENQLREILKEAEENRAEVNKQAQAYKDYLDGIDAINNYSYEVALGANK